MIKSIVLSSAISRDPWDECNCDTKFALSFQPTESFQLTFHVNLSCPNLCAKLISCMERIINFFFHKGTVVYKDVVIPESSTIFLKSNSLETVSGL